MIYSLFSIWCRCNRNYLWSDRINAYLKWWYRQPIYAYHKFLWTLSPQLSIIGIPNILTELLSCVSWKFESWCLAQYQDTNIIIWHWNIYHYNEHARGPYPRTVMDIWIFGQSSGMSKLWPRKGDLFSFIIISLYIAEHCSQCSIGWLKWMVGY